MWSRAAGGLHLFPDRSEFTTDGLDLYVAELVRCRHCYGLSTTLRVAGKTANTFVCPRCMKIGADVFDPDEMDLMKMPSLH